MHQDNKTKKISIARKKLNVKFWACKNEFLMRVRLLLRIFLGSTCGHNQCNFRGNLCCASEKDRDLVRYCMKYVIINSIIKTRNRCSTHIYHIMFSKTNSSPNLFHGSHLGFGKSQFLSGQKGNFEPRFPSVWRQSRGRSGQLRWLRSILSQTEITIIITLEENWTFFSADPTFFVRFQISKISIIIHLITLVLPSPHDRSLAL